MSHNPRLTQTIHTNSRVTTITTSEGTTNYQHSCQSNISKITQGSESFSFTYDGALLKNITQQGILNQALSFTYDGDFRVGSFTYADHTVNYTYDRDGLLTGSGDFTITRNAENGLIIEVTDGNKTTKYTYNNFGDIRSKKDHIFKLQLRRKQARITKKEETVVTRTTNKRGKVKKRRTKTIYHYVYDTRDRLTEVYKGKKRNRTLVEQYSYDSNGNRASATVYGVVSEGSYTLDDNLIVYGDNTYRYDDDGYLVEKSTPDGITTYTYGTMGELREVVTPTKTIAYQHNAKNQRVAKLIDNQIVEKYLWADLTTLLAVYDANDNPIQRFEYANQRMPVAMTQGATKYYLHYDQVGSLRAVSDSSHNIVKEIVYDTYGNILTDSNSTFKVPFGFAGGLYDSNTGLVRFGYRDYDSFTGKWTAKDPIEFDGGDSNLYGYVLGDPVNFVDPTGEYWQYVFLAGRWIYKWISKAPKPKPPKKGTWSCIGKIRYAPTSCSDCPDIVAGLGLTKSQAQRNAKFTAPEHCRKYYGHFECHVGR